MFPPEHSFAVRETCNLHARVCRARLRSIRHRLLWEGAMKFPHRRQFLHLAASAATLAIPSRFAWAQAYPTRPVRLIAGAPPGGGIDITARLIGQSLSERLGQAFVIENKAGAGTNIGTEFVVRASPDGYTLLLATNANAVNATLMRSSTTTSSVTSCRLPLSGARRMLWWLLCRSHRNHC